MREFYTLLSDSEAVIWIMEYAKKSKVEATQIVHGFRKSHRGIGVADQMKIHAEVLPGCTFKRDLPQMGPVSEDFTHFGGFNLSDPETEHCLVSWLPVPLADCADKDVPGQKAVIDMFKAESGLPDWYEVSFGSINHVAGMALAHFKATTMHPFNGLAVNTDSYDTFRYRLRLQWADGQIHCSFCPWDEDRFPRVATFAVGVVKALPMAELIPEGYEILENVEPSNFEMKDLEFIPFLQNCENPIRGPEIHNRALAHNANLGYANAKYIMVRSAEIPRQIKSVLFPGTRLADKTRLIDQRNSQVIPYIYRLDDNSWRLGFVQFNAPCVIEDRFVRCKQD